MSVEDDPLSPVPQHTKPISEGQGNRGHFEKTWMRWFIELRDKVNVINAIISGLSKITGIGFPAFNGTGWNVRSMQPGPGVDVANPDGSTGNPTFSFNIATAEVPHLSGATYSTVKQFHDVMNSPGLIDGGGNFTVPVAGTLRVLAGKGLFRIADDDVSTLTFGNFAQTDFVVPADGLTRFFGVNYNSGTPIVEMRTSFNWNNDTEWALGTAANIGGNIIYESNPFRVGDPITNIIQRFDAFQRAQRDNSVGGLILSEFGTRNMQLTGGKIWARLNDFVKSTLLSTTTPMFSVYWNGTALTFTPGLTQWPNTQFNNVGAGTLQVMGNNKYAVLWFFTAVELPAWGFAYGTNEYNTLADAAQEGFPSYLTTNLLNQTLFVGRLIFQKNAATASRIDSAFTLVFNTAPVTDHNSLSGIQDAPNAVANEHYHLSNAQGTAVANAVGTGGGFVTIAGTQTVTGLKTFISTLELTDSAPVAFNGRNTGVVNNGTALASFGGGDASLIASLITFRATENWTGLAKGCRIQFRGITIGTTTLGDVASMDEKGFGVGTTTPNYAGFIKGITVEGTNCVYEMASARPDASGVLIGAFSGNFRTNSAGHQRICDVQFTTDGPTANQRGGELGFYTKPDASTTLTQRWRIGQTGHLRPAADNTYTLGDASLRTKEIFSAIGAINTSDAKTKTDIRVLTATELAAASDLARSIRIYHMKDSIDEKGDKARWHVGWLAQTVRDIMAAHGLDGFKYGFLCYDEWEEQPEVWQEFEAQEEVWEWSEEIPAVVDPETGDIITPAVSPIRGELLREAMPARRELIRPYLAAGSLYGLRKDELQAFITAAQEQRLQALEALQ